MRWNEGLIHISMRDYFLRNNWSLIAGELPGGTDHDLYPLNVTNPNVARDNSPDPRRHSLDELIPDLVALRKNYLVIAEAKVAYDFNDQSKLVNLLTNRLEHLHMALEKFAVERGQKSLLPVGNLILCPVLVFSKNHQNISPIEGFTHLQFETSHIGRMTGFLEQTSL